MRRGEASGHVCSKLGRSSNVAAKAQQLHVRAPQQLVHPLHCTADWHYLQLDIVWRAGAPGWQHGRQRQAVLCSGSTLGRREAASFIAASYESLPGHAECLCLAEEQPNIPENKSCMTAISGAQNNCISASPPSTYGRSLLTGSAATSLAMARYCARSLGPAAKKTTEP